MIELKVKLSASDYAKVSLLLAYKKPFFLFISIIGGLGIIFYLFQGPAAIFPQFLVGLFICFIIPLLIFINAKNGYNTNKSVSEESDWIITDTLFKVKGASFEYQCYLKKRDQWNQLVDRNHNEAHRIRVTVPVN